MKLAIEILKREISQRELAQKHNHLYKDEVQLELESLNKAVKKLNITDVMVDLTDNHVCRYSKTMNQPYPRLCADCGKPEVVIKMAKSLEKEPMIIPSEYDGLWSAYYVEIIFSNGNKSHKIKLDQGVRGINCECKVTVDNDGWVYVR